MRRETLLWVLNGTSGTRPVTAPVPAFAGAVYLKLGRGRPLSPSLRELAPLNAGTAGTPGFCPVWTALKPKQLEVQPSLGASHSYYELPPPKGTAADHSLKIIISKRG